MRRFLLPLMIIFSLIGCRPQFDQEIIYRDIIQEKIDSFEQKLSQKYPKVSYGGTMGMIQNHHLKLWFAGLEENWNLADFYHHELEEHFELLENYRSDKEATQYMPMIKPSLEAIDQAIENQSLTEFKSGFKTLSNTCTKCHQVSGYPELEITIPTENPFYNQKFEVEK